MDKSPLRSEPSLFSTVDFRAFLETLRLRWWVIPAVVVTSIGFLQLQDSDARTEPATFVVSREYEISSPRAALGAIGINTEVAEFPSVQTQLLILQSNDVREAVAKEIGKDIDVQVPDSWTSPATFVCNEPEQEDCERAIEAYVAQAVKIRQDAIATGISNLRSLLTNLQATSKDPLLPAQVAALEALSKDFKVESALINTSVQEIGPTISQVGRSTYVMGIAAGLLIALLILLQLTHSDSRVRSARQLVRIVGAETYLGSTSNKTNEVRDRRAAVAMLHGLNKNGTSGLRYLPLRQSATDEQALAKLASMSGATHTISKPFGELSVPELINPTGQQADVIVVKRNRDLRNDVVEVMVALERAERPLAGVLLVD